MNDLTVQPASEATEATHLPLISAEANSALTSRLMLQYQIAAVRPRRPSKVRTSLIEIVTIDADSAQESMYALPRSGKPVTGPSIRFAEALKQAWGNCWASSHVQSVNREEKYVESIGLFIDFETNAVTEFTHQRSIAGRNGRIFNDDMIRVTANAASSIAMREAILKGVPKPIWRAAYEAVQKTIAGDVITLNENREKAVKSFAVYGVKPEQIFSALGVSGELDITLDHIVIMRGMFAAIKNGEETVESIFAKPETSQANPNSNPLVKQKVDPETGEVTDSTTAGGGNDVAPTKSDGGHQPKTGESAEDRSAEATRQSGKADETSATNSTGGAAADQSDLLSAETGGRTQPVDQAGAATAASASPADTLKAFAKSVFEFTGGPRELSAANTKFWNENGGRPTDKAAVKVIDGIYSDKLRALNNEITPEELGGRLDKAVEGWRGHS